MAPRPPRRRRRRRRDFVKGLSRRRGAPGPPPERPRALHFRDGRLVAGGLWLLGKLKCFLSERERERRERKERERRGTARQNSLFLSSRASNFLHLSPLNANLSFSLFLALSPPSLSPSLSLSQTRMAIHGPGTSFPTFFLQGRGPSFLEALAVELKGSGQFVARTLGELCALLFRRRVFFVFRWPQKSLTQSRRALQKPATYKNCSVSRLRVFTPAGECGLVAISSFFSVFTFFFSFFCFSNERNKKHEKNETSSAP